MVKNKFCKPKIINKILTFETRYFMINENVCEIIGTQIHPYFHTIKVNDKKYTLNQEQLIKKLGL